MLRDELARALRQAWSEYSALGETIYAFGLYVVAENGLIIGACCATEEATRTRADEYAWMMNGSAEERARVIRWWDADWPHANDRPRLFDAANKLLADQSREDAAAMYISVVEEVAVPALRGVFGVDRALVERSIVALNAPSAAAEWRAEVAAADHAYATLQK
jgi:hypothetical protein